MSNFELVSLLVHSLIVQSYEHVKNADGKNGLVLTFYTGPWWPKYDSIYDSVNEVLHLCIVQSSVDAY